MEQNTTSNMKKGDAYIERGDNEMHMLQRIAEKIAREKGYKMLYDNEGEEIKPDQHYVICLSMYCNEPDWSKYYKVGDQIPLFFVNTQGYKLPKDFSQKYTIHDLYLDRDRKKRREKLEEEVHLLGELKPRMARKIRILANNEIRRELQREILIHLGCPINTKRMTEMQLWYYKRKFKKYDQEITIGL